MAVGTDLTLLALILTQIYFGNHEWHDYTRKLPLVKYPDTNTVYTVPRPGDIQKQGPLSCQMTTNVLLSHTDWSDVYCRYWPVFSLIFHTHEVLILDGSVGNREGRPSDRTL